MTDTRYTVTDSHRPETLPDVPPQDDWLAEDLRRWAEVEEEVQRAERSLQRIGRILVIAAAAALAIVLWKLATPSPL